MPTPHTCITIRQTIFSTKVSKLIYFPSLIMPNCLITLIKIHNWLLSELNQYTCHGTWFLYVYFVTWSYDVNPVIRVYLDRFCNYVSPSNEGRHIVLVWFFLPLLLLLLSEACPDHNFFVFRDRSMIFRMWVHDHKMVCHEP